MDEVLAVGDAEFQATVPGADGGLRQLRADRPVRLPQHAGRRAALRPRDPARRRPARATKGRARRSSRTTCRRRPGAGSSRTWSEDEAPGDDLVRLRSVRIVDDGRRRPWTTSTSAGRVGIELGFTVLERGGPPVVPKLKVTTGGRVAFNAMDIDARWHEPSPPGDYVATAWIPGNLLNEGLVSVDAAVCSIDSPKLHHHVVRARGRLVPRPGPRRGRLVPRNVHRPVARRRPPAPRVDGQVSANRVGSSSSSSAPAYV